VNLINEIITRLYEYSELSKGIFWFTCIFSDNKCDFSKTELIYLPFPTDLNGQIIHPMEFEYNSKDNTSVTHKNSWKDFVSNNKELRNRPWNYFPRGRVEIKNNRANIFINPNILQCPNFEKIIKNAFNLNHPGLSIKIHIDNSSHYNCYSDFK